MKCFNMYQKPSKSDAVRQEHILPTDPPRLSKFFSSESSWSSKMSKRFLGSWNHELSFSGTFYLRPLPTGALKVPASWPWLYKFIRIAAPLKRAFLHMSWRKYPKHTHTHTYIYICIIICNMLGGNCDFCYLVVGGTNAEVGDPFFALENDISRY